MRDEYRLLLQVCDGNTKFCRHLCFGILVDKDAYGCSKPCRAKDFHYVLHFAAASGFQYFYAVSFQVAVSHLGNFFQNHSVRLAFNCNNVAGG